MSSSGFNVLGDCLPSMNSLLVAGFRLRFRPSYGRIYLALQRVMERHATTSISALASKLQGSVSSLSLIVIHLQGSKAGNSLAFTTLGRCLLSLSTSRFDVHRLGSRCPQLAAITLLLTYSDDVDDHPFDPPHAYPSRPPRCLVLRSTSSVGHATPHNELSATHAGTESESKCGRRRFGTCIFLDGRQAVERQWPEHSRELLLDGRKHPFSSCLTASYGTIPYLSLPSIPLSRPSSSYRVDTFSPFVFVSTYSPFSLLSLPANPILLLANDPPPLSPPALSVNIGLRTVSTYPLSFTCLHTYLYRTSPSVTYIPGAFQSQSPSPHFHYCLVTVSLGTQSHIHLHIHFVDSYCTSRYDTLLSSCSTSPHPAPLLDCIVSRICAPSLKVLENTFTETCASCQVYAASDPSFSRHPPPYPRVSAENPTYRVKDIDAPHSLHPDMSRHRARSPSLRSIFPYAPS
ncbi:hypothetical protein R3P38DRAFT_3230970 [Favolaschia claudopus]|uniref:Uncharacterized protein n=1 Tax=Favolaschia claudopus TaxID=2862362 RepID=A0AAV9ZL69_9AGAR